MKALPAVGSAPCLLAKGSSEPETVPGAESAIGGAETSRQPSSIPQSKDRTAAIGSSSLQRYTTGGILQPWPVCLKSGGGGDAVSNSSFLPKGKKKRKGPSTVTKKSHSDQSHN